VFSWRSRSCSSFSAWPQHQRGRSRGTRRLVRKATKPSQSPTGSRHAVTAPAVGLAWLAAERRDADLVPRADRVRDAGRDGGRARSEDAERAVPARDEAMAEEATAVREGMPAGEATAAVEAMAEGEGTLQNAGAGGPARNARDHNIGRA